MCGFKNMRKSYIATSAVDSSSYPRRPRFSGGCNACMEQSATRDSGLLLTFDIPEGDQVSPFSSVIRLTWRRLLRWSADVCIELCNSLNLDFCKVRPQLCDGSTLIHDICVVVVVVVVAIPSTRAASMPVYRQASASEIRQRK